MEVSSYRSRGGTAAFFVGHSSLIHRQPLFQRHRLRLLVLAAWGLLLGTSGPGSTCTACSLTRKHRNRYDLKDTNALHRCIKSTVAFVWLLGMSPREMRWYLPPTYSSSGTSGSETVWYKMLILLHETGWINQANSLFEVLTHYKYEQRCLKCTWKKYECVCIVPDTVHSFPISLPKGNKPQQKLAQNSTHQSLKTTIIL